jgi:predicted HTH domain antitoxin
MQTLSVHELVRHDRQHLLAVLHDGAVAVTDDGKQPVVVAIPLTNSPALDGALIDLASQLYDAQQISLERAARIAGLSYSEMIDALGQRGIASLHVLPGELEAELGALGS